MKKTMLLSALCLFATAAEARKFALVVGGPDKALATAQAMGENKTTHEFAQSTARVSYGLSQQGYEVVTLFDSASVQPTEGSSADFLQTRLQEDFSKLRQMGARSATKSSILETLRNVAQRGQAGDEFEFTLFAHGFRSCDGDNGGVSGGVSISEKMSANRQDNCEHVISLTNPTTGAEERIPTRELKAALKAIDDKNIKTNLTLTSCHSGAAQEIFPAEEFPNTCSVFLASANNVGFGCFPSDTADDESYTSALDMVMGSHYMPYADSMLQDPYFKKDPCLKKISDHYRRNRIEPAQNRYELFMNARRADRMPHEPSISSQLGYDYFTRGKFSPVVAEIKTDLKGELCFSPIQSQVLELLDQGRGVIDAASTARINALLQQMQRDMSAYNASLIEQRRVKSLLGGGNGGAPATGGARPGAMEMDFPTTEGVGGETSAAGPADSSLQLPPGETNAPAGAPVASGKSDPAVVLRVKEAQQRTFALASEVMDSERAIIDIMDRQFLRSRIPAEDPCLRNDPRPRVAAGAQ